MRHYKEEYHTEKGKGIRGHVSLRRIEFVKSLKASEGVKSILDVGAIDGEFIGALTDTGVGIDLSKSLMKLARSLSTGNDFVVADSETLPFKPEAFDVVHMFRCYRTLSGSTRGDQRNGKSRKDRRKDYRNHTEPWLRSV